MVSLSTIKDWFRRGLRPTESQFSSTWDSFWHKDEQIPLSSIENLQENLDDKLDVEVYENADFQKTSFKNVGDGIPNVDTTIPAYREGKIGIGEPDPIETVDVIGSAKFQHTYSDGSIARTTLGGENTNSEIGLPSGLIKTNTLAFFPDQSVHPETQGYFYTGDISAIVPASGKLSTGMGIASLTNTKYARSTFFPSNLNGNPESEFVGVFEARHEDGNETSIQAFNKGGELGKQNESFLFLRASNTSNSSTRAISRITLSPRIAAVEGALLQLKEYANNDFVPGFTYNDDEVTTGTPATIIGDLHAIGTDSDGNVGKILTVEESFVEVTNEEGEESIFFRKLELGDHAQAGNSTFIKIDDNAKTITSNSGNAQHILEENKIESVIGDTHVKVETRLGTYAEMVSGNAQLNVSSGVAFMGGDRVYIRPNLESPLPTKSGQFLQVIDNQGQVAWADAPGGLKSFEVLYHENTNDFALDTFNITLPVLSGFSAIPVSYTVLSDVSGNRPNQNATFQIGDIDLSPTFQFINAASNFRNQCFSHGSFLDRDGIDGAAYPTFMTFNFDRTNAATINAIKIRITYMEIDRFF